MELPDLQQQGFHRLHMQAHHAREADDQHVRKEGKPHHPHVVEASVALLCGDACSSWANQS